MKLTLKHTALSLALAGSFALTGCNFIGSGDPVYTDPDPAASVAYSGDAVKGTLASATVSAFLLSDTEQTNNLLAGQDVQTVSDEAEGIVGEYSFSLEGVNGPVVVVITADADTTMVCDAVSGCGEANGSTIAFGDIVPAANLTGLVLSTVAYVDSGATTVRAPVNTLTTIAADIAKAVPSASKAQIQKLVLDLIGISDDEQSQVDIFTTSLVDGNKLSTSTANAVVKKLSAFNAALSKVDNNANASATVKSKLDAFVAAIKKAATSTTPEAAQEAVNEATDLIKEVTDEVVVIGGQIDGVDTTFEDPEIIIDGTPVTGGTGGTGGSTGGSTGGAN